MVFRPGGTTRMLSTLAIAFSMSTDAFAASLSKGATLDRLSFRESVRIGVIFGSVEAVTPLIGWGLGIAASAYVVAVDHWIAFGLLGVIGLKMIWEGLTRPDDAKQNGRHSTIALILTALGTSIDALAIGVTLSIIGADILVTALAIGAATCFMVGLGVIIGRFVGAQLGRAAEVAGGLVLIVVGSSILTQHLGIWT